MTASRQPWWSGGSTTGVWAWLRGGATGVALNLSDSEATVPLEGEVLLSTKGRDDPSRLEPWEGVVVALT